MSPSRPAPSRSGVLGGEGTPQVLAACLLPACRGSSEASSWHTSAVLGKMDPCDVELIWQGSLAQRSTCLCFPPPPNYSTRLPLVMMG